jgi:phospholipid-binding lipoprotein MlaA
MNITSKINWPSLWVALVLLALLQGCAPGSNPRDPFEPFNRKVASFNDGLDTAIVKPVAQAYENAVPSPVRTGATNFFGNLSDIWSAANSALQLKPKEATESLLRVGVNTLFGFAGFLDLATEMGLYRHSQDFGLTLGRWGVPAGPYLVLPVLGPSTVRDGSALVVDSQGDMLTQVDNAAARNTLYGLRAVNLRARLLRVGDVLDQVALDKYSFARDFYLQRRGVAFDNSGADQERYDLPETGPPQRAK